MAREQDGPTGQAFVTRWRGLIREDPRTTGTYLAVLYALADYADSDGTSVHPSQARLARNVGVHVRQIRRYLGRAESEGWVARDGGRGNQHQATEYRLTSAPAPDMGVLSSPEGAEGAEDIHVLSETPAPDMGVLSSPEGAEGAEDIHVLSDDDARRRSPEVLVEIPHPVAGSA